MSPTPPCGEGEGAVRADIALQGEVRGVEEVAGVEEARAPGGGGAGTRRRLRVMVRGGVCVEWQESGGGGAIGLKSNGQNSYVLSRQATHRRESLYIYRLIENSYSLS